MTLRSMLQRRGAATGAAVLMVGGMALYPRRTAYAEAPRHEVTHKKPIYDDDTVVSKRPSQRLEVSRSRFTNPSSPSPTDQLAAKVGRVRLFLYTYSLTAENKFNDVLSRILHAESRFTSTIASLAPSRESGERLLPGTIYVFVSAMAGSIVSRNRGIFLRLTTPVAFGTVAAATLLPVTMRNVGDLVWEYEKKVPAVAEKHVQIRTAAEESWRQAVAHTGYARNWLEGKIGDGRELLEEWVRKGR